MKKYHLLISIVLLAMAGIVYAALVVPTEIQQPGTQPNEVGNLESPDKCDNCHGGYDMTVEPAHNWRGSMMANAGRDPIFWATLAVAEQDFDGAGDLCIRCHSTAGWLGGRSTPTDGSGLASGDADGVECDFCHKMTDPDNTEHMGVMNWPFIANDSAGNGYYGSGMASIWGGSDKLGPYSDPVARHQFMQSAFHRSNDFCGTCHDVSNPAVGDLAHNNGTQGTSDPVVADGSLGTSVEGKAAFNNFPFMYGIVERTFSEFKSSALSGMPVSAYGSLPDELQAGAMQAAYDSAGVTSPNGPDYEDGTTRFFNCQTCHMRPVSGYGCNKKGAPLRSDLPLHDMTGGNYWMPDAIQYLDTQGKLLLGGQLTDVQLAALASGKTRVMKQLNQAASLAVSGNTLRIVNLTGHKLISGYPEGRRMWLNIKWYDGNSTLVREDGAYGIVATIVNPVDGRTYNVESLQDLHDPNTKIYEAHYGLTKEWAAQLLNIGVASSLPLDFNRVDGSVETTLGELANSGSANHESFHFVLNNTVVKDNRIPPYGMAYNEARQRNALPVPADQYGNPGSGGTYNYYDEFVLNPPAGAVYATIDLVYQPTSWEYIQFLWLANDGQNTFLSNEGVNLLDAWLNTGMAAPYVMTSTVWGNAPVPPTPRMVVSALSTYALDRKGNLVGPADTFAAGDKVAIEVIVEDESGSRLSGVQVFMGIYDGSNAVVTALQGFTDVSGAVLLQWKTGKREPAGTYRAQVVNLLRSGYEFDAAGSVSSVTFVIQ